MNRKGWLAEEFEHQRPHLRGVAYRMLGSISEAEDAVQEAWVRLDRADPGGSDDLRGWLTVVVGRIALDMLRSRRSRREDYAGSWLPEPIVSGANADGPEHDAALWRDALPCCDPFGGYLNSLFLTGQGVNIARTFWRDLIGGLQSRDAPLEVVLAYSLQNEQFTMPQVPPFTLTSGLVTTGNGQSYDMASPDAKIEMAEDNVIYWANNVANTIRDLDPTALVTMGFFAPFDASVPAATLLTFERLVRTKRFLNESNVDFFDFHAYPALDLTLPQIVAHYGMAGYTAKPIIMGELGAFKLGYPTARTAASGLVGWQIESCPLGFDGWLTWSWGWDDPVLFNATDDNGAIAKALAPSRRPNPCTSPPIPVNLALGRPVQVSGTFGDQVGPRAVDGLGATGWNSGGEPPGTFRVDLGSGKTIREIRLLVEQDPAGGTSHQIQVRNAQGTAFVTVAMLSGSTQAEQWLRWFPNLPLHGIRWVRIVTTASPSWVAWREVQVY